MILGRRGLLQAGAGLAVALVTPSERATAQTAALNMQLGWLGGGNQLGEACAHQLGYFKEEGLDFHIQPGGPNNDGIAIVASGRYEVGQVSSSPSLMLAVSQDIPIRCFAVSAQKHPYAFSRCRRTRCAHRRIFPAKRSASRRRVSFCCMRS
jgi:NitT/TauT family transport system substrate-binding protein